MFPLNTLRAAFGTLALAVSPLGAADPPPVSPEENPLVLPPLEVRGQFAAEGWVYARIDCTEFLSQLSAKQTRALIDDFVIFQDFVRAKYPEAALPAEYPVTVVLCDRTDSFRQFGGNKENFSATMPDSERFILIDASQLNNLEKVIRRKWTGLAFKRHPAGKYPLWRELGTRQILADIRMMDGRLELGFPQFFPSGTSAPGFTQFNLPRLLPLSELFSLTRENPEYRNPESDLAWVAHSQSTAFMHLCLFSTRYQRFRQPFQQFIRRLESEPVSESLFRDCFGMSYVEMNRWLRSYALSDSRMRYETLRYKYPPTPSFTVREARPAEVLHLLRECQRLQAAAAKSR